MKRELENQVKINDVKRKETIPTITSEILPSIVSTSSLLPLGIIGLLLYSRTGRK